MNSPAFSKTELIKNFPLLEKLNRQRELTWINPLLSPSGNEKLTLQRADIEQAAARLQRFAPYIAQVFPETAEQGGIIESPLVAIADFKNAVQKNSDAMLQGSLWQKCDSHLPIAGSIKARGGIYEILFHAEKIALAAGKLKIEDDYNILANEDFQDFFAQHSIVVGSTGNLGLSIGIMSAKLGFKVSVHMSADARQWKKDVLRSNGVNVIEHEGDYGKAVEHGRKQALATEKCHFVDDENSQQLFLGYSIAALHLQKQLIENNILVDAEHPLFVYLPCGVGGAPGGITFGIKQLFGNHVHCFFAEPTAAPCMLLGMHTGLHDEVCVQDIGLDGLTCADGLAVGRASGFVGKFIEPLLSGIYTVADQRLYDLLTVLQDSEGLKLEPSALASNAGIVALQNSQEFLEYVKQQKISLQAMANSNHIAWATGGRMVPDEEYQQYYQKGVKS
ncbi:D-serine dehydratase [Colwellia sp. MT41]|uniref:D-serine ammonia-lyase n=1 Tax=Colwellia sp. MT41 TaxID=58049 RepID=UPI00071766C8|nr:D-serine ammonia-lyase [Colwellia sp. MT41]ALO33805.1 D-serine dehydratase [Colwellia sp. MT41]